MNRKIKKFDLVEITWVDSIHDSGWHRLSEEEQEQKTTEKAMIYKTVGYLLHKSKTTVKVCQSYGLNRKDPTIDAIMQIPRGCISNIKKR